eukprot:4244525-Prymnesium_polylepis.1
MSWGRRPLLPPTPPHVQARLALRLATLPHDALASLAARITCENAGAFRCVDEVLLQHRPLP